MAATHNVREKMHTTVLMKEGQRNQCLIPPASLVSGLIFLYIVHFTALSFTMGCIIFSISLVG